MPANSRRRSIVAFCTALCVCLASYAGYAGTPADEPIREEYLGIQLIAKPLPAAEDYDTPLAPREEALAAIKVALNKIYNNSPFAAQQIMRLKDAGQVTIVYDAAFPKRKFTSLTIAAFFPDFYKRDSAQKDFVVVVGRYGAHWNTDDLGGVLIHELVGHGLQRLRGDIKRTRQIDLECEAYLHEDQFYQALGLDRTTDKMVRFQNAIGGHWCNDFRRFMSVNLPSLMHLWGPEKPDIPGLLTVFAHYKDYLNTTGETARAIANLEARQRAEFDAFAAKVAEDGMPQLLYTLGLSYLKGIGTEKDAPTGYAWILKAAQKGHDKAQALLAMAYLDGSIGRVDEVEAYKWYSLAADNGSRRAADRLVQVREDLDGPTIEEAEQRIRSFLSRNGG